jgi:hypothetical protein
MFYIEIPDTQRFTIPEIHTIVIGYILFLKSKGTNLVSTDFLRNTYFKKWSHNITHYILVFFGRDTVQMVPKFRRKVLLHLQGWKHFIVSHLRRPHLDTEEGTLMLTLERIAPQILQHRTSRTTTASELRVVTVHAHLRFLLVVMFVVDVAHKTVLRPDEPLMPKNKWLHQRFRRSNFEITFVTVSYRIHHLTQFINLPLSQAQQLLPRTWNTTE